jgi:SAM-dependent methyltransferase
MSLNKKRIEMFRSVWSKLRVPVRPGPEGLDLYRYQMKRLPGKHILVLGATPELVDMAIELKAEKVVSVERNPEIIEAMRQLGQKDWSMVRLVAGDWLEERPEFEASFDCAVCDGGLLFLQYPTQWEKLFRLVYSYLKPGGIFVAKEWAEPKGQRDYDQFVLSMISSFETANKNKNRKEIIEAYMYLASELRLATFINATRTDCSFDQDILVRRLELLMEDLMLKFPDPEMVEITEAALKYLARSQPGTTDVVAGARYEQANKLLRGAGFRSEHFPLPDRPIVEGNYMFVAYK